MATLKSNLIVSLTDRVSGAARGVTNSIQRLRGASEQFAASQRHMMAPIRGGVGQLIALAGAYVGVTTAIQGTVGAAISFEDAMSGVKKVVDFESPAHFQKIRQDIIDLTKEIPRTAEGFAALYEAAGQSGIATRDLRAFATMAAKVGVAWGVTDEIAGESLAKLKTALGRDIEGVGLLADAINHLSNNSAAGAPDLLNYTRRIGAVAEMAGFSAEQGAAFGAAMIGSGFEAEVAATSFRNMVKALQAGGAATASQKEALTALGLNATAVAKRMQKDAVGTTLDVMERIGKLPEYKQGMISQLLFGSEARALATLIKDTKELRRVLGMVADEQSYAGSAQEEYARAADRTSNKIQLMWNKIKAWSREIGTSWLPMIGNLADKIGTTFDTLDERVTVFDEINQRVKGFLRGLGFEDGTSIAAAFNATWDAIFGRVDEGIKDSEELAAAFENWRRAGEDLREFGRAIGENIEAFERFFGLKPGAIGEFIKDALSWTIPLIGASVGIAIFAGAVRKLANALLFLTGLSTAWKALKWASKLAGFGGAAAAGGAPTGVGTAAGAAAGGAAAFSTKGWMKILGLTGFGATLATLVQSFGDTPGDTFEEQVENQRKYREGLQKLFGVGGDVEEAVKDGTKSTKEELGPIHRTLQNIDGTLSRVEKGWLADRIGSGWMSDMMGSSGGYIGSPAHGAAGARSMSGYKNRSIGGKTFSAKAVAIINRLKDDFGLTTAQAAGIVGNLGHESMGFTAMQEINPLGGGRGGLGWAQWTASRRRAFEAWAKARGLDPRSDAANYGFLKHELKTTESRALAAVRKQRTPIQAMRAFERTYERAGVKNYDSRARYTTQAYDAYLATRSGTVAPTTEVVSSFRPAGGASASAAGSRVINFNPTINVTPAPGMDEEKLAAAVHRKLSEDLSARSREAFSDGVY